MNNLLRFLMIAASVLVCCFCAGMQTAFAQGASTPPPTALAPVISSFSPASVYAGDGEFTLTIHGYGFQSGAQVLMSSVPLSVLRVDSTTITVRVPAVLIGRAGLPVILIRNPDGQAVGARYAVITDPLPPPRITSLEPSFFCETFTSEVFKVKGQFLNYVSSAALGKTPLTILSSTNAEITLQIPAGGLIYTFKELFLTLKNRDSISTTLSFPLAICDYFAPGILTISPASNTQRSGTAFQLTIKGDNFVQGAKVALLGVKADTLQVTSMTGDQIIATIPASIAAGQYTLRVINPDTQFAEQPYGILTATGTFLPYPPSVPTLSLAPNPATEAITISAELPAPTRLTVRVLNVLQREALPAHTEQAQSGLWETQIDLSTLPRGAYTVELTSSDGAFAPQVRQVLKQ
jgi:hypothetical protein